jgi:hypothetical protein
MATTRVKSFEKQFNAYLIKYTYAVHKDIEVDWNEEMPFHYLAYQSYDNLCLGKKDPKAIEKPKNRFAVSTSVRQFLCVLYFKMVEELKNIEIPAGDDFSVVRQRLLEENTDCYSEFMFALAARQKDHFGDTLVAAKDTTAWLFNQTAGMLIHSTQNSVIIAHVAEAFDTFLKSVAWLFGRLTWYNRISLSEPMFLGLLFQQDMSQTMLDELRSSLRPKPPSRARPKAVTEDFILQLPRDGAQAADADVMGMNTMGMNTMGMNTMDTSAADENFVDFGI